MRVCVRELPEWFPYRYLTTAATISMETLRLRLPSSINGTDAANSECRNSNVVSSYTQVMATLSQPNKLFIRLVTIRIWIFNFVSNRWRNEAICNNFLPFPGKRKFPINFVITLSFCTLPCSPSISGPMEGKKHSQNQLQSAIRQPNLCQQNGIPSHKSYKRTRERKSNAHHPHTAIHLCMLKTD